MGRYQEAETLVNEAISILDRHGQAPEWRYRAYWCRALVKWQTGRRKEAVADLEEALGTIEWLRARAAAEELQRAGFFATKMEPFELMVSWQAELGDAAGVFSAMERSRARVLLEQMDLAGQDLLAGLPEEEAQRLRQKEAQAAGRVSSRQKQLQSVAERKDLSEAEKAEQQKRLEQELSQAQYEYVQVRGEIRAASPVYRLALQKDRKSVPLEQMTRWASQKKALVLEYMIGWEGSYLLVLPPDGAVRVEKLSISAEQAKRLEVEAGPLDRKRLEAILQ
jgi:hypothetical protein